MDELEQWLADVKALTEEGRAFDAEADRITERYSQVEKSGKAIGLKVTKIRDMLPRFKCVISFPAEMPETEETGK